VVPARYDRQENCRLRRRSQRRGPVRNVEKRNLCVALTELQAPWVLYGQASRAISTG
jgi:hypothetical protein